MNMATVGRFIIKSVTHLSVSQVIMNVVDYTTPVTSSTANKVVAKIGGFVISSMVADQAVDYVLNELDGVTVKNVPPSEETIEE